MLDQSCCALILWPCSIAPNVPSSSIGHSPRKYRSWSCNVRSRLTVVIQLFVVFLANRRAAVVNRMGVQTEICEIAADNARHGI